MFFFGVWGVKPWWSDGFRGLNLVSAGSQNLVTQSFSRFHWLDVEKQTWKYQEVSASDVRFDMIAARENPTCYLFFHEIWCIIYVYRKGRACFIWDTAVLLTNFFSGCVFFSSARNDGVLRFWYLNNLGGRNAPTADAYNQTAFSYVSCSTCLGRCSQLDMFPNLGVGRR